MREESASRENVEIAGFAKLGGHKRCDWGKTGTATKRETRHGDTSEYSAKSVISARDLSLAV